MSNFLDKTGLSYFWSKVKTYLATNFLQKPSGGSSGQVLTKSDAGESWGDVPKEILKVTFSNYNSGTATFGTVTHNAKEIYQAQSEGKIVIACNLDAMFYAPLSTYYQYASGGDTQTYELHFTSGVAHLSYTQMYDAGGSLLAEQSYFGNLVVSADGVTFDNAETSFESTNVQAAIEEVNEKIPSAPKSVTVTLPASGWTSSQAIGVPGGSTGGGSTGNQQTVTVQGVLADESAQLIQPMPAIASQEAYMAAGVYCSGQAANSLTFTCQTVPTADLTVYVVMQEVGA